MANYPIHVAKKAGVCVLCERPINVGEKYWSILWTRVHVSCGWSWNNPDLPMPEDLRALAGA